MVLRIAIVSLAFVFLFGFILCADPSTPKPTTTKLTTKHDSQTTSHSNETTKHDNPTTKHENPTTKHENPTTKHDNPTTNPPTTKQPPTVAPTIPPTPLAPNTTWNVTDPKTNKTCIMAKFATAIQFNYTTGNKNLTTGYDIPVNATVDLKQSSCDEKIQVLTLDFKDGTTNGTLTLHFNKSGDTVNVDQVEVNVLVTDKLFPGIASKDINKNVHLAYKSLDKHVFSVDSTHSYVCDEERKFNFNVSGVNGIQSSLVDFSHVKLQGFIQNNATSFSAEQNCKGIVVSNLVPIVVGAALAGLVLIVLIAYFIGRRRSRRLAYQSV